MELTPASVTDKRDLYALHVELFRHHIEEIWGWDDAWQMENFEKEWQEAPPEIILHDGQNAGCVQVRHEPDHLYLLNLALRTRFQGQGLGAATVRTIQQRAAAHDLSLRLSVFRTNPGVIPFYQLLGFRIEEETATGSTMRWEPQK